MYTSFGSLNTSLQALHSMQQAIQTSSHNVANANTPGYSRQKTVLAPGVPYTVPTNRRFDSFGQVGTGVTIEKMQRFRDSFLDSQIRKETLNRDGWEVRRDILQQAEVVWNEPSDTSVNSRLSEFWTGMKNLSTTPDSASVRTTAINAADDLATTISDTYRQFNDLRDELDSQVARHVDSINGLAQRIAGLNEEIRNVEGVGQQPNDLRDQRDRALTELAGYVNIDIHESESGTMMVSLGGKLLVMDQVASQLRTDADPTNGMLNKVVWDDTGVTVQIGGQPLEGGLSPQAADILGGKLGGTLVARDILVPNEMNRLDSMAATLITEVNTIHRAGFGLDGSTGLDFFTGTGALDIAVNSVVAADTNKVAAATSATSVPGDGYNALLISRLANAQVMNSGTTTLSEYYRAGIAELGQQAQQSVLMTENQDLLVQSLEERQEQISGVSLDEETTNLIQFQHAYQSAARVMTTVDGMLDTVINRMGLVGR